MNEPVARCNVADEGRVALVTGAGGGLGPATCRALAELGMHVVVSDVSEEATAKAAAGLNADGFSASELPLDVTDRVAVDAGVAGVAEEHGRLDVLVNMAGVLRNQPLTKVDDDDFALVLATHLTGTMYTMRAAAPIMRNQQYGRIVNTSSIVARGTVAGSAYTAAKAGIEGLTRTAAIELGPRGITANCVSPGLIRSGMFLTVPEEYQELGKTRSAVRRLGEPEDVGAAVAFLASAGAAYVTGQVLLVCGGMSIGI